MNINKEYTSFISILFLIPNNNNISQFNSISQFKKVLIVFNKYEVPSIKSLFSFLLCNHYDLTSNNVVGFSTHGDLCFATCDVINHKLAHHCIKQNLYKIKFQIFKFKFKMLRKVLFKMSKNKIFENMIYENIISRIKYLFRVI